jgi:hypothetical protein
MEPLRYKALSQLDELKEAHAHAHAHAHGTLL